MACDRHRRRSGRRRSSVRTVPLSSSDTQRHHSGSLDGRRRLQLLLVVLLLPSILILQSTRAHWNGVRVVERAGVRWLWLMGPVPCLVAIRRPGSLRLWTLIHAQGGIHLDWLECRDTSQARICCSLTGLKSHASSPTFTLRGSVPSGTS